MEKITRQELADDAAKRWRSQYPSGCGDRHEATHEKLMGLPKGTPPDEVDRLIGNGSWTNLGCDECGADGLEYVVRVGEEQDYESCTADLCGKCIEALKSL